METIHIYSVPGLGANSKIFEKIQFPKGTVHHPLEWLQPLDSEETLNHYAHRMAEQIEEFPAVLLGVSFGGIMVQEMAQYTDITKIIIVSSIKDISEFPSSLSFFKKTKTYKLFPSKYLDLIESFAKRVLRGKPKMRIDYYQYYLDQRDPLYLDWAIENIMNWAREIPDSRVFHIQGSKDQIFPTKHLVDYESVEGGDHAMILLKAKKISSILTRELNKLQ
ncbi:MAG: alpha/beta hydrolase [Flavobacteriaceae bacterium]